MPVALGLEKITEESPEYLGLENVVTDEMAEVAVVMDKRVPITAAEVTKKCGKPLARTEELLEELALRGVIEYTQKNQEQHKQNRTTAIVQAAPAPAAVPVGSATKAAAIWKRICASPSATWRPTPLRPTRPVL